MAGKKKKVGVIRRKKAGANVELMWHEKGK